MPQYKTSLEPNLERKLERIRAKLEGVRRKAVLTHFGLYLLALVVVVTILLSVSTIPLLSNLLIFLALGGFCVLVWTRLIKPMRTPVTRERVALLIDEQFPELKNRMVSLVDVSSPEKEEQANKLTELFLKEAQKTISVSKFAYQYDLGEPLRGGWVALGALVIGLLIPFLFRGLWTPSLDFSLSSNKLAFTVEPGDARVREGDEVIVSVRSDQVGKAVSIKWRTPDLDWQSEPMRQGDSEHVHFYRISNLVGSLNYQVRFGRMLSPVYTLTTWVPPEVTTINHVYNYPEYLKLPPRTQPNSGDIDAIEGTIVDLEVEVNKPMKRVAMVMESGEEILLEEAEATVWRGQVTVNQNGRFHFDLVDKEDQKPMFSPTYEMFARPDQAPEIKIDFPFRDMSINALAEVDFAFEVSDDHGLADYGIRYQIAGGESKEITLAKADETQVADQGRYQLQLENLNLEAGDLITWTVFARDQKPDRKEFEWIGDPYFLEIVPFARRFRMAVSDQGGQQGGGMNPLKMQKDVIIATWNLRRKLGEIDDNAYEQDRLNIVETENSVLEAVQQMIAMTGGGPEGQELVKVLNETLDALDDAVPPDPGDKLTEAGNKAQKAYRLLLKMQPPDTQVSQSRSNQGNSPGGQQNSAAMNELEMKRNRNFYEDERRTQQQQQAAAETLDKIRDLAQRQEMVNEEIARLVSEQAENEDPEELRRRLDRLREEARKALEELDEIQRDTNNGQMDQQTGQAVRDQLDQAREEMNRGLERLQPETLQEARSAGSKAVDELSNLEKDLEEVTRGSTRERVEQLQADMEQLQRLQEDIEARMAELGQQKDSPRLTESDPNQENKNQLMEDKQRLSEELIELMQDAAETANMARGSQELVSRELGDWVRRTSKEGIIEEIDEVQELLKIGVWDELPEKEAQIGRKLDQAAEELAELAGNMVSDELEAREKALGQLNELEDKLSDQVRDQIARGGSNREDGEQRGQGREQREAQEGEQGQGMAMNPDQPPNTGEQGEQRTDQNGRPMPGEQESQQAGNDPGQGDAPENRGGRGGQAPPMSNSELQEMQRFAQDEYREWQERLETVEQLLPTRSPIRGRVEDVRREVEKMRREYRRENLVPRFDIFIENVATPLVQIRNQLQADIEERKEERNFLLRDDGAVPDQYRKNVAEYFRALSESEGGQ